MAAAASDQPGWMDPELATLTRDRFSDPGWIFERKLDGERCLAFRSGTGVRLMTLKQKEDTSTYPEITQALPLSGPATSSSTGRSSPSTTARPVRPPAAAPRVRQPGPDLLAAVPVSYYIFDVLWADGRDLRPLPLRERKRILRDLLSFAARCASPNTSTPTARPTTGRPAPAAGRGSSPSAPRALPRRPEPGLAEVQCASGQEFVIGGFTDPQGARTGFGALLLGYYDPSHQLVYARKVGTGFSQRTLDSLHTTLAALEQDHPPFDRGRLPRSGVHWVQPRLVAEVGFSEWTTDGGLRHPKFQGLRDDKDPADVVLEMPQDTTGNGAFEVHGMSLPPDCSE